MKKNKALLLTFDYELFLGKSSGTVDNCLIIPTNHLLDLFDKHNIQAVFFVDTVYIMRMIELSKDFDAVRKDLEKIRKQLLDIIRKGHSVFHHIHPHWLDSVYLFEINQWDLSNITKLTFDKISEEERSKIMAFSNDFLLQIYKEANSDKIPFGYRAGGLFIEPFDLIKSYFKKYNIINDYSVVFGDYRNDAVNSCDFRNVPSDREYRFSDSISNEDENGEFVEFPISTIVIKNFYKVFNGLYYRLYKRNLNLKLYGDGLSIANEINKSDRTSKKNYFKMTIPASVEILNPVLYYLYKRQINNSNYFHLLSHPKLLTIESLKQLDKLLKHANSIV